MEYRLQGEEDWTEVTETEITGLAAGTYEVRYAAKAGFNAGATAEVTVPAYVKSTDATLSDLTVDGKTVTGFAADTLTYDVELAAGTTTVPTIVATVTDGKANAVVTPAESLPGATTVVVTAEDGTTTKTYTINFTVANADQEAPTGLTGVAPTTADGNDGKITGVDDTMEYKLKSATVWIKVTGTEITGLAAGTYEVRYAAKEGYNAGGAAEVIVPEYEAPIVAAEIDKVVAENGKLTITLKEKPTTAPEANDFSATRVIDDGEATDFSLSNFAIDEDGVTITFTFEEVEQTEAEQSVVVAVKLDDGDKVAAVAFIVDAEEVGDAAAAQAVIDAIETLPAVEELTLDDKDAVVAAKAAYGELTPEQKGLISEEALAKLNAAFKQVFLEELDAKVAEKISSDVAKYTRDGDSLTVEFVTTDGNLILPAAQGLAIALMDVAYGSTLNIGETPFVLNETIDAGGLVGALSTAGAFGGNPVPYSADIIYNTISGITLDGELTFKLPSDN